MESPPDDNAIKALRGVLIRGLKPALSKYVDRELEQFVEDVAQDSLLKILDNIHTFRGESKFTTWAMKIAVREGLTELRRKRYDDISLEDLKHEDNDSEIRSMSVAGDQPAPDRSTHESQLMEKIMIIIDQELTDKQKMVIKAIVINGIPPSVVAEQMGTNRNALYKVVHDARLKLKHRFERDGIDPDEMLNNL
ncbi:MAG: sigma-70 family RNA polymerase sigma factor [Balneolaceae bacterium]|nr:sigma-70 family RNA polymerase sigma factor [Balneolaceae bacterium]